MGDFWVGTEDEINRFIKKEKIYKYYNNTTINSLSNSPLFPMTIAEDSKQNIWIGTANGLLKYIKQKDKFVSFHNIIGNNNSIRHNAISSLFSDSNNQLWIGTGRGLKRYNKSTNSFKNFTVHDGIQSSKFNQSVSFQNKDGKIFFGVINEITAFYPKKISLNMNKPRIFITRFKLFNRIEKIGKKSILSKSILSSEQIVLNYNENFFSFEFAALDFTAPYKNKYKYKLFGVDKDWISTNSKNRTANYTNIQP